MDETVQIGKVAGGLPPSADRIFVRGRQNLRHVSILREVVMHAAVDVCVALLSAEKSQV